MPNGDFFLQFHLPHKEILGTLLAVALCPAAHASLSTQTQIRMLQYANEVQPVSRFDFQGAIRSQTQILPQKIPLREAELHTFYEPGAGGEYSFDVDPAVLRFAPFGSRAHFWIGRTHPLQEGISAERLAYTSATGSRWAQNRTDPMNPRVSGWPSLGARIQLGSPLAAITFAFSPIFLPSFDPSLDLSDARDPQGTRFSRLPPREVSINGSDPLPLRYRLDVPPLTEILFQSQAFAGVSIHPTGLLAQFFVMSTLQPDPETAITNRLRIQNSETASVLITVRPSFPRRNEVGTRIEFSSIPLRPEIQALFNPSRRQWTGSFSLLPVSFLSLGILQEWTPASPAENTSTSALVSPVYSRLLTWAEMTFAKTLWASLHWKPALRIERHWAQNEQDLWIRPTLIYQAHERLAVHTSMNLLSGTNTSYYGQWRALDRIAMGVQYLW